MCFALSDLILKPCPHWEFENVTLFSVHAHENEKLAFSNSSGLKSIFSWKAPSSEFMLMVGLSIEIKLRFQISLGWCWVLYVTLLPHLNRVVIMVARRTIWPTEIHKAQLLSKIHKAQLPSKGREPEDSVRRKITYVEQSPEIQRTGVSVSL